MTLSEIIYYRFVENSLNVKTTLAQKYATQAAVDRAFCPNLVLAHVEKPHMSCPVLRILQHVVTRAVKFWNVDCTFVTRDVTKTNVVL